jgi:hypothetical protein
MKFFPFPFFLSHYFSRVVFVACFSGLMAFEISASAEEVASPFLVPVEDLVTQDDNPFLRDATTLSTQETHPYLFSGRLLNANAGMEEHWNHYGKWIARFSSALDCLENVEQEKSHVDLRKIDWEEAKVEVCLFRIFSTLKDPVLVAEWLNFHGFRVRPFREGSNRSVSSLYPRIPTVILLDAYWTSEQYAAHRPSLFFHLFGGKNPLVKNYYMLVGFEASGAITSVSFSGNSILN